jgi:hypothetical protein
MLYSTPADFDELPSWFTRENHLPKNEWNGKEFDREIQAESPFDALFLRINVIQNKALLKNAKKPVDCATGFFEKAVNLNVC